MKTCVVRFVIAKMNRVIESKWMNTGVRKLLRTGLVPAIVRGGQAPGTGPTDKLKLRSQMAAGAGEKSSTSLLLFLDMNILQVDEKLSTIATEPHPPGCKRSQGNF